MHKDSITDEEVIDLDFLGKKIYPPKKLKLRDAGKEFAALFREIALINSPYSKKQHFQTSFFSSQHSEYNQPCMVKMYYTDNKQSHLEFLRNYMPQLNKKNVIDKPVLFNGDYNEVPEFEILNYEKIASDRGFKFIISPESQNIDMKLLVRQFVKNLEIMTGFKFTWMAVTHTDTGHTHSHLLINGIDKKTGKEIIFDKETIKKACRTLAGNICTELIGPRSKEQIEASRLKLPLRRGYTKIDSSIIEYPGYKFFPVSQIIDDREYEASKTTSDDLQKQRLNALVDMGLAIKFSKNDPPVYYLEKDWEQKLKSAGRYNTFLSARAELKYVSPSRLIQYTPEQGIAEGIITKIYNMNDEDIWTNAVVIENRNKNIAWYVPLRNKLNDDTAGKFITVKAEKNAKGKLRPLLTIH